MQSFEHWPRLYFSVPYQTTGYIFSTACGRFLRFIGLAINTLVTFLCYELLAVFKKIFELLIVVLRTGLGQPCDTTFGCRRMSSSSGETCPAARKL